MYRKNDGTNLIVNYLPQTVDEDELTTLFAECGMVEAVKVIRDGKSQISRGFAFVKFVDKDSADKAIKKYTGFRMGRKTLRVSLSRPAGEETRDANLAIENIPLAWESEQLYEQFCVYGQIVTHNVLKGKGRDGKAYVRYNTKAEAEDAITGLNGINIGGEDDLVVKFAEPPTVRATPELLSKTRTRSTTQPYPPPPRPAARDPYARDPYAQPYGRDPYAAQQHYYEDPYAEHHFPGRPRVTPDMMHSGSRNMIRPPMHGRMGPHRGPGGPVPRSRLLPQGHGPPPKAPAQSHQLSPPPTSYKHEEMATDPWASAPVPAPRAVQLTQEETSRIPENHRSSYDPEKGWCVFVYNLPATTNDETMYKLFCKFGAINTVKPVVDKDENCRGFGFVHMLNYDDACRSIQSLDGYMFQGKTLQVRFKNAKK